MKALSLRQPHCEAILSGGMDVINRYQPASYPGDILIHASKTIDPAHRTKVKRLNLRTGGIVGMVEIVDCVEQSESIWFDGPYGLVLQNPRPIPFIECKGDRNFFNPSDIRRPVIQMILRKEITHEMAEQILGLYPHQVRNEVFQMERYG
ncbi:MAG: hypothetical protein ABJN40_13400 [Sneathiella sp.]